MKFFRGTVWAQGQIFFQPGWLPGLMILAAMAVSSPWFAVAGLLGAAVQAGTTWFMAGRGELSRLGTAQDIGQGLHGFCGALTGCAAVLACGPGVAAFMWTLVGSSGCAAIVWAAGRVPMVSGVPLLTFPFCLVNSVAVAVAAPFERTADLQMPLGSLTHDLAAGMLRGMDEVILGGTLAGGNLVVLALFLAGWDVGLWALVGAVVGTITGYLEVGQSPSVAGPTSYSAVLVGIALGAVFPFKGSPLARYGLPLVGIALTVPLWWFLHQVGIAPYTWPFVIVTWAGLLVQRKIEAPKTSVSG